MTCVLHLSLFSPWGGGVLATQGDFDHTMKHQWGEFDLCINSQSRGNFDIRHLESLCGFDIKMPGNKYGGEASSSFIEKGIL
jgi:hypothetical protein